MWKNTLWPLAFEVLNLSPQTLFKASHIKEQQEHKPLRSDLQVVEATPTSRCSGCLAEAPTFKTWLTASCMVTHRVHLSLGVQNRIYTVGLLSLFLSGFQLLLTLWGTDNTCRLHRAAGVKRVSRLLCPLGKESYEEKTFLFSWNLKSDILLI